MRRVIITDHAFKRWHERANIHKSKNQLAHIFYNCLITQAHLGFNLDNKKIKLKVKMPQYEMEAVSILQGTPAKWKVKTFQHINRTVKKQSDG